VPLLSGCAQHWAKSGGTSAEFDSTKAVCRDWTYQYLPQELEDVQLSPGYITPLSSVCEPRGHRIGCVPVGGTYVPPNYAAVDRNDRARSYAMTACLNDAGWVSVDSKAEAQRITNSAPVSR